MENESIKRATDLLNAELQKYQQSLNNSEIREVIKEHVVRILATTHRMNPESIRLRAEKVGDKVVVIPENLHIFIAMDGRYVPAFIIPETGTFTYNTIDGDITYRLEKVIEQGEEKIVTEIIHEKQKFLKVNTRFRIDGMNGFSNIE